MYREQLCTDCTITVIPPKNMKHHIHNKRSNNNNNYTNHNYNDSNNTNSNNNNNTYDSYSNNNNNIFNDERNNEYNNNNNNDSNNRNDFEKNTTNPNNNNNNNNNNNSNNSRSSPSYQTDVKDDGSGDYHNNSNNSNNNNNNNINNNESQRNHSMTLESLDDDIGHGSLDTDSLSDGQNSNHNINDSNNSNHHHSQEFTQKIYENSNNIGTSHSTSLDYNNNNTNISNKSDENGLNSNGNDYFDCNNKNIANNSSFSKTIIDDTKRREFHCHKAVLMGASPVLCAMFSPNSNGVMYEERRTSKITMEEMVPSAVECMLHYIYFGELLEYVFSCRENINIALQVLCLSDKYDIKGLKEHCEYRLHIIDELLCPETGLDILIAADRYNAFKFLSIPFLLFCDTKRLFFCNSDATAVNNSCTNFGLHLLNSPNDSDSLIISNFIVT